jgi:formate dehydrogenase assembly factor FdhD
VELAAERRMLLCGFARGGSFNVYAGGERLRN